MKDIFGTDEAVPPGYLVPVAYLWTRTVTCKNPTCKATVPLVKQTWLCKKADRYVALKMIAPKGRETKVRFEVVESRTEKGWGSTRGRIFKGRQRDLPVLRHSCGCKYVKEQGCAKRVGQTIMAVVCARAGSTGKSLLSRRMTLLALT